MDQYTRDLPRSKSTVRSKISLEEKALKSTRCRAEEFLRRAPTFKVDLDLETLTTSIAGRKAQQDICDTELGPDQPAQVFSAQWQDRCGRKLAFYLADRWRDDPVAGDVSIYLRSIIRLNSNSHAQPKPLKKQYQGRTQADLDRGRNAGRKTICDGLNVSYFHLVNQFLFNILQENQIDRWHESTQILCAALQPVCPPSDIRHPYPGDESSDPRIMRYRYEVGTGASYEDDGNTGVSKEERAGVHHLVSGWIQQAQAKKVRLE